MLGLAAIAAAAGGCKRSEESAPPGEAYGCVLAVDGERSSCLELDATATTDRRTRFARACDNEKLKHLRGRLVRHCRADDVVAVCALAAENATMRFYASEENAESLRGAAIGCKARGGVFSEKR